METRNYPLEALFCRILTPFERFLRRTTAGGIVLVVTTVVALGLAAALGDRAVHHFWDQKFTLIAGRRLNLTLSWHEWVNDGLMALFFLVVGLELKREMLVGELSSLRDAALPLSAALGGMVVPALIYLGFNAGSPAARGWGIPMATDIAFAVGILALLAWRVPRNLVIFLTALAIADDLGAVLVIALFYTAELNLRLLGMAGAFFLVLVVFNRSGIRHPIPYAAVGVLLWVAVHASGVHATLSGILLALTIPRCRRTSPAQFERRIDELQAAFRVDRRDQDTPDDPLSNHRMASIAEAMEKSAVAVQSPAHRVEHALTPWVAFLVVPIFALANAGIDLAGIEWSEVLMHNVTAGVVAGLAVGKFVGISAFSWIAVALGLARLPAGVEWKHLLGAAWLGGIGFTMSLFIAQLAFHSPEAVDQAKFGILLGSAVSAIVGLTWLALAGSSRRPAAPDEKSAR